VVTYDQRGLGVSIQPAAPDSRTERRMDLRAGLAQVQEPVLLVFGQDGPFDLPMAEATRDALVTAQVDFVFINGCGHFWHECPDEFYPRVQEFLGLDGAID
jgi:pimeloyl-ACP methyl ester carboxylesterase